jgi:hypothetical protein
LVFFAFDVWFLPATRNSLPATASFAGAVIVASAILRRRHRWIAKGLYSRCAVVRRRIFPCSYGLQRDRAWSELRRMSLWTNPENAQNLSSSAARSLPRCYSLRILTRFEFGCGSRNRGFSQRRRKSHSSKRVTVAKSASLQNLLRIPYSLPVTRYPPQPTPSASPPPESQHHSYQFFQHSAFSFQLSVLRHRRLRRPVFTPTFLTIMEYLLLKTRTFQGDHFRAYLQPHRWETVCRWSRVRCF